MNVDSETLARYCIKAAIGIVMMVTIMFWGSWFMVIFSWLMVYPIAILLSFFLGFLLNFMGAAVEDPRLWMDTGERIVERVGTVGQINGEVIHEYIVLKRPDNDELVKLYYERCVDLQNEWGPPDNLWFVVEPGGILYVQSAKEKAEAAVAKAVEASDNAEPENISPVDRETK